MSYRALCGCTGLSSAHVRSEPLDWDRLERAWLGPVICAGLVCFRAQEAHGISGWHEKSVLKCERYWSRRTLEQTLEVDNLLVVKNGPDWRPSSLKRKPQKIVQVTNKWVGFSWGSSLSSGLQYIQIYAGELIIFFFWVGFFSTTIVLLTFQRDGHVTHH